MARISHVWHKSRERCFAQLISRYRNWPVKLPVFIHQEHTSNCWLSILCPCRKRANFPLYRSTSISHISKGKLTFLEIKNYCDKVFFFLYYTFETLKSWESSKSMWNNCLFFLCYCSLSMTVSIPHINGPKNYTTVTSNFTKLCLRLQIFLLLVS